MPAGRVPAPSTWTCNGLAGLAVGGRGGVGAAEGGEEEGEEDEDEDEEDEGEKAEGGKE